MCGSPSSEWHLTHPWAIAIRLPYSTIEPWNDGRRRRRCRPAPTSAPCAGRAATGRTRARHDHDLAPHLRVPGAAVLRAEDLVAARLGRLEPGLGVAARQDVLLDAEVGDEERVDDVAAGHEQPHRPVGGDVERADGVRPVAAVGELPHPLLGHHVDVHRVLGRRRVPDVVLVALHEPEQEEEQRHADDDDLELDARDDDRRRLVLAALAVLEEEDEGQEARR